MLHFNEEWLNEPNFAEWLVKVTNDDTRAYCRWCAVVLRAHKPDLMTHGGTIKHSKNAVKGAQSPAGPISVQIIPNDEDLQYPTGLASAQYSNGSGGSSGGNAGTSSSSTTPKAQSVKRYRVEWEEIPELQPWLAPHPTDTSKAYCKYCDVAMRAHKHDLMVHSKSIKHNRALMAGGYSDLNMVKYENGAGTSGQTLQLGEEILADVEAPDGYFDEEVGVPGDELPPTVSHSTPTSSSKRHSQNPDNDISIIRVQSGANSVARLNARMARKRKANAFGASDVIEAIESNEFTGYELLQIVKAAIPKL